MPITVEQRWSTGTRSAGNAGAATLHALVSGTDDLALAYEALESAADLIYDGIELSEVKITERLSDQIWAGETRYGTRSGPLEPAGGSSFAFEIGGQTTHITQSKETINTYAPAGETAPDNDGAINATSDRVDGVDIQIPVYSFSETHNIDKDFITATYKSDVFFLVGRTNNASFKGFSAGEVLFLGASGSLQNNGDTWEIRYSFAASPNASGLAVGSISGINKDGWEYLWVLYDENDDNNQLIMNPRGAYVERVYDSGDFGLLGI